MSDENISWSDYGRQGREIDRYLARRGPVHTAHVDIGRERAKVEVFEDGITRLLVPHIPNFYSIDALTDLEHKAFRRQRRAVVHELIAAVEAR